MLMQMWYTPRVVLWTSHEAVCMLCVLIARLLHSRLIWQLFSGTRCFDGVVLRDTGTDDSAYQPTPCANFKDTNAHSILWYIDTVMFV